MSSFLPSSFSLSFIAFIILICLLAFNRFPTQLFTISFACWFCLCIHFYSIFLVYFCLHHCTIYFWLFYNFLSSNFSGSIFIRFPFYCYFFCLTLPGFISDILCLCISFNSSSFYHYFLSLSVFRFLYHLSVVRHILLFKQTRKNHDSCHCQRRGIGQRNRSFLFFFALPFHSSCLLSLIFFLLFDVVHNFFLFPVVLVFCPRENVSFIWLQVWNVNNRHIRTKGGQQRSANILLFFTLFAFIYFSCRLSFASFI